MIPIACHFLLTSVPGIADPHRATQWDSTGTIIFRLFIVLGLILLNGFFVASEFAIVKIRASKLDALIEQGDPRAKIARKITDHLEAYLSATQLGVTLSSLALGWVGEPFVARIVEPVFFLVGMTSPALVTTASFAIAFSLITILHIVLGELAPKSLAIRKPAETVLWISRPLSLFHAVFRPISAMLEFLANLLLRYVLHVEPASESERALTSEELRICLSESLMAAEVTELAKRLAIHALDLRDRVVHDIMVPRSEVVFLDLNADFGSQVDIVIESRRTRFPVCMGTLDEAVGIVHTKDLLKAVRSENGDLSAILRKIHHVSVRMPIEKLLDFFLSNHAHLALAVDEYGDAVGVVTLDNILNELVGKINDEFDVKRHGFVRISDSEFETEGSLALHLLTEDTGIKFPKTEVSTIGGYVTELLGRLPARGESVIIGEYLATVAETDGRKVLIVNFKKL
jgi:CBS domain containing-hemolysin-like protein